MYEPHQNVLLWAALPLALGLAGCGGAAERAAPQPRGPATWLDTAPATIEPIRVERPARRLSVAYQGGELPDLDPIDDAIALQSVVASIGSSSDGIEVDAGPVHCLVNPGPALAAGICPNPSIKPDVDAAGLTVEQAKALKAMDKTGEIVCTTRSRRDLISAPPLAIATAVALAKILKGQIWDPQARRFWTIEALKAGAKGELFNIARSVQIVVGGDPRAGYWLATRGMIGLDRPDLFVAPVSDEKLEAMKAQLLVLADAVVRGGPAGIGSKLEVGSAIALLVPLADYQASLPPGTPGRDVAPTGPRAALLAVVPPAARPGDLAAIATLVNRLTAF